MLFCGAGYNVHMYDISKELVSKALEDIGHQLRELEASKMLRGNLSPVEQLALIKGKADQLEIHSDFDNIFLKFWILSEQVQILCRIALKEPSTFRSAFQRISN